MYWRRVAGRIGLVVAVAIPTVTLGLPYLVRGFVRAVVLLMDGCLSVALSISTGASVWSVIATIGRASMAALVTPMASVVLVGLVAVSLIALYVLQRVFGSENGAPSARFPARWGGDAGDPSARFPE
jgi:hypothetical protein